MAIGCHPLCTPALQGDDTALQISWVFTDSTNCSLCTTGTGGQNPFLLLPVCRPQCNWNMENTVQPLCIWRPGTLFTLPATVLHPFKSSTFPDLAPFGAGVQHQRQWCMMESIPIPLFGCSRQWRFTSLTAPSAQTPVHGKACSDAPCLRVQPWRDHGHRWRVLRQGHPRDHGHGQPMPTLWPWMNHDRAETVRNTLTHNADLPPIASPKVWDRLSVAWSGKMKNSDWEGERIGIWLNLRLGRKGVYLRAFLIFYAFFFSIHKSQMRYLCCFAIK